MKNVDKTKLEYSYQHSKDRYKERYDSDLTLEFYIKLNKNVKYYLNDKKIDDEFIKLETISKEKNNTGDQYVIKIITKTNNTIFVVYEIKRDCITTFLPPNNIKIKK